MRSRVCLLVAVLACAAGSAQAGPPTKAARRAADKGTFKTCDKGKCHRIPVLSGRNAAPSELRSDELDKPSGDIWLRAENLGEEVKVHIYKPDGTFDDAALAKLDDLFRDPKTGAVRAVRSELYEHLSRIYDRFGDHGARPVVLVSGFRFRERDSSRHYHASAMDIRVPGVSIYEMYKYAESLDAGGMGLGIYPTGGFIHVDFRAPGEPSYRWTDYSGHGGKKPTGRTQPARKPTS